MEEDNIYNIYIIIIIIIIIIMLGGSRRTPLFRAGFCSGRGAVEDYGDDDDDDGAGDDGVSDDV